MKSGYPGVIQFHSLLFVLLTSLIGIMTDQSRTMSFAAGSLVIWLNWWLLGLSWRHVEGKKPIALAAGLIVIKYPLLAAICLLCLRQEWFRLGWFAAGIATVIPAGFWGARRAHKIKT